MNENWVELLHHSLVDALRRNRPQALDRPVTVAEIYQDLVPYRSARTEVGFEMNADYEHTLLRLLAGEGDLARIEPREVRDKLRMELESPNPDVGLFRNYAACDVWVKVDEDEPIDMLDDELFKLDDSWEEEFVGPTDGTVDPGAIQQALATPSEAPTPPFDFADEEQDAEAAAEAPMESPEQTSVLESAAASEPELLEEEEEAETTCGFCGAELPSERMVNFCPYCGTDQSQRPCPSCGELLDPLWRYCIACGASVRRLGDHLN